jgi:carbonic anhydrase
VAAVGRAAAPGAPVRRRSEGGASLASSAVVRAHSFAVAVLAAAVIVTTGRVSRAQHPPAASPPTPPVAAAPSAAPSADAAAPMAPPAVAAEEVLARLKQGNAAFVAGKARHPHQALARIHELAAGQHPIATVLTCSDSRVPDELVFDQGFGDLFTVRVAGNVAANDEIATIEYGVDHLGTSLLVVLGHTKCGAVTAVATGAELHGHLAKLAESIQPAVAAEKAKNPTADPKAVVEPAIVRNVLQAMADVLVKSPVVRARLKAGQAHLVGALYHVEDGTVDWLGEHPDQAELVAKADAAPPEPHAGHGAHGGKGAAAKPAGSAAHDGAHGGDKHPAPEPPAGGGPNLPIAFAVVAAIASLAGGLSSRLIAR